MPDFKKKLIRNFAIIGAAALVFGIFFYLLRANISKQLAQINELGVRRSNYSVSTAGLSMLKRDGDLARSYKDQINAIVPTKDGLVAFSKRLQDAAKSHAVALSFTFGNDIPAQQTGTLRALAFSATLEGDSRSVLAALKDFEENYYALKTATFDLTTDARSNTVRLFLTGSVFYYL